MLKVDFDSILYIESLSDYIKIHISPSSSSNSVETIVTRETISAIEAKLPKTCFIRIHRSYIVNISKIQSFTNEYVALNKISLTISRSYKQEVLKQLEKY